MTIGRTRTVVYSLLPLLFLCILLEGTARLVEIWRPPLRVDYGWGFDPDSRIFIPWDRNPGVMTVDPARDKNFHRQYFQMPKPDNFFRIVLIGASCMNYADVWMKLLGSELSAEFHGQPVFEMINMAVPGYGTHRLVSVVAEAMRYQPDLLLFYEAGNEFCELEQLKLVRPSTLPLQKILYKSAFCRFIRDRWALHGVSPTQRARNRQLLNMPVPDIESGGRHHYTEPEIQERMTTMRNNLSLIISLCKSNNVPLVVATEPSSLWNPLLENKSDIERAHEFYQKGQYAQGAEFVREKLKHSGRYQASDSENGIIRDLTRSLDVPLADVEARIIAAEPHGVPGETTFLDHCHFTTKGQAILTSTFKEKILEVMDKNKKTASP